MNLPSDFTSLIPACAPQGTPLVIAGPCSAETHDQVMETAVRLAREGIRIFRAGLWKPRTKPGGFEGVGARGLPWLREVREATGMAVATEVATRAHVVEAVRGGMDILWIGARTSANPFAVQEIADTLRDLGADVGLMVKNPVSPDLDLWIGAVERIRTTTGLTRIAAVHRGFSAIDTGVYRNAPLWEIPIGLRLRMPRLPLLCDPSHIAGDRRLVEEIMDRAADMGYDGLIVESHCSPCDAWSDAAQQLEPEDLASMLRRLRWRSPGESRPRLELLRSRIDDADERLIDILASRMEIADEIGELKRHGRIPVVQPKRFNQLLAGRIARGRSLGLSEKLIRALFSAIHEESVRRQL